MSTAVSPRPSFRTRLAHHKWPIGYVVVIVFLFFLYFAILPNLVRPVSAPVIAWLPVATINECLMWAIMALGLNVVVGYAGLLDLGYVAFWALGGYTAGWLMAFPFNWTWDFRLLPRSRRGRPAPMSTSGWSASSPAVCARFSASSSARRRCGCAGTTWRW